MPNFDGAYARQLALLVDVLPVVAGERDFALKGGTAINLFFRDLPRLSVDIDLAWLPSGPRAQAVRDIDSALERIAGATNSRLACHVQPRRTGDGIPVGLAIRRGQVTIKVDVTPVLRGSVYPAQVRTARPAVVERFGLLEMQTLAFPDVFAGKLVAALDRQHPRDLFDVMHLLANEGITDELWRAFLVYLTACNRPIAEMLDPRRTPLQDTFVAEFAGMTADGVGVADLERTRESLVRTLQSRLGDDVRAFLLSVEREAPEWHRLDVPAHVGALPGVQWKLINLARRDDGKRARDLAQLVDVLDRIAAAR